MILGPLSLLPPYSTEVPGTAARAGGVRLLPVFAVTVLRAVSPRALLTYLYKSLLR